jgi:hypothetical protein
MGKKSSEIARPNVDKKPASVTYGLSVGKAKI